MSHIRFLSHALFIVRAMNNKVIHLGKVSSDEVCVNCECVLSLSQTDDGRELCLECDCGSFFLVA